MDNQQQSVIKVLSVFFLPHFKLSFIHMELLFFPARFSTLLLLLLSSISFFLASPARADDPEALLALKSSIDPSNALPWPQGADFCRWQGVKGCLGGRVTKLVIEFRNLSGGLEGKSLNQLNQLRVLSFKSNSLAGAIPDISGLTNLKSLYLSDNRFSGDFPESIASLHRLKVIVLSSNRISGRIPVTLLSLVRLCTLFLQNNELTGEIPPLNQSSLRYFNVSGNRLSGRIPSTPALVRFNLSAFPGNRELWGEQVALPCNDSTSPPPVPHIVTRESGHNPTKREGEEDEACHNLSSQHWRVSPSSSLRRCLRHCLAPFHSPEKKKSRLRRRRDRSLEGRGRRWAGQGSAASGGGGAASVVRGGRAGV